MKTTLDICSFSSGFLSPLRALPTHLDQIPFCIFFFSSVLSMVQNPATPYLLWQFILVDRPQNARNPSMHNFTSMQFIAQMEVLRGSFCFVGPDKYLTTSILKVLTTVVGHVVFCGCLKWRNERQIRGVDPDSWASQTGYLLPFGLQISQKGHI